MSRYIDEGKRLLWCIQFASYMWHTLGWPVRPKLFRFAWHSAVTTHAEFWDEDPIVAANIEMEYWHV